MKRLLILVFALFIVFEANQSTFAKNEERKEVVEKVKFPIAYSLVREYEGNYVNNPLDRGGETYGGVARRFNKQWYGWKYVDQQKRKRNERVDQAEFWVQDYYLDLWVKEGWDNLYDQRVANYLFEFRINSPVGIRIIQKSLIDCGFGIQVDNKMSVGMINSINLSNSKKLLKKVQNRRIKFYKSIARRDSSQKGFLKHWLKRAQNI